MAIPIPIPIPKNKADLERQLNKLESADSTALKEQWQQLYGSEPPEKMSQDLLRRAVAYKFQEKFYGGLNFTIKRQLRQIAQDVQQGKKISASIQIKSGTRLVRSWQGKLHTVLIQGEDFNYEGKNYRSLSAIAKLITGTQWNGRLFFGLKTKTGSP